MSASGKDDMPLQRAEVKEQRIELSPFSR